VTSIYNWPKAPSSFRPANSPVRDGHLDGPQQSVKMTIQPLGKDMSSENHTFATPIDLYRTLSRVWSADTSSPTGAWLASNPAMNHCSITSLVAQDFFGGEILCTRTAGGIHFYNQIDGVKWDLTVSQFPEPIPYDDTLATREQALADTSAEKYRVIKERIAAQSKP
jgi:hypothetical protein